MRELKKREREECSFTSKLFVKCLLVDRHHFRYSSHNSGSTCCPCPQVAYSLVRVAVKPAGD